MPPPPTPKQSHIISADGKLLAGEALKEPYPQEINLIWDGTRLTGGVDTPSISDSAKNFLPASIFYRLTKFEVNDKGQCLLSYEQTTEDPATK